MTLNKFQQLIDNDLYYVTLLFIVCLYSFILGLAIGWIITI